MSPPIDFADFIAIATRPAAIQSPSHMGFSRDATLFRGFNGAGKTSLISAICWCLTGYGHRSQGLPFPLHIPINIQVAGDDDTGTNAGFGLPPIVPFPTETELVAVDGHWCGWRNSDAEGAA